MGEPSNAIVHRVVRDYVELGNLVATLRSEGCPSFPAIRFVSYHDNVVRILTCGDCPGCDAPWLRNICNKIFCNRATEVMARAIPAVKEVRPVYTFDDDFANIVSSLDIPSGIQFFLLYLVQCMTYSSKCLIFTPSSSPSPKYFHIAEITCPGSKVATKLVGMQCG